MWKTLASRKIGFMILLIVVLQCISAVHGQPISCNEDFHCPVGFFCRAPNRSCQQCFSCEQLGRHPATSDDCVKSGVQCGPCFQGLITNYADWTVRCMHPEKQITKIRSSFMYILMTCIATGFLLSLFIIYAIWNTHVMKVNIRIAVPSCQKITST